MHRRWILLRGTNVFSILLIL